MDQHPDAALHVHWIENADLYAEAPRLEGLHQADICIIGGGYLGLWTGIHLRRQDSALRVALVESEFCGFGASGRNGGIAQGWWTKFPSLRRTLGVDSALALCREAEEAIDELRAETKAQNVDAFRPAGWLWAATDRAQLGAWEGMMRELARAGVAPFVELDRAEIVDRTGSERCLAGILERGAGVVQPALLVRALRSSARAAGVHVFENSPVDSIIDRGRTLTVETPRGTVSAARVVLASGAWLARLPQLRRRLFVVSSDMVATASDAEALARAGVSTDLAFSDSRMMVNYMQATPDGRLAWGRGGGALGLANRVGPAMLGRPARRPAIEAELRRAYPTLGTLPIETAWSGPVDRSPSGLPLIGWLDKRARVAFAAGFSGNGVAPSAVAARSLAALTRGETTEVAEAFAPSRTHGSFPPEPLRFLGGVLIRAAVSRKERAEACEGSAGLVTRRLASLAPGGSKE